MEDRGRERDSLQCVYTSITGTSSLPPPLPIHSFSLYPLPCIPPSLSSTLAPIPDMSIIDDDTLINFIPHLAASVRQSNQCVYVHCWGGHGRTGVVIACLLASLYGINEEEALKLTQAFHSKREESRSHSPQTAPQFEQVRRVVKKFLDVT